MLKYTILPWKLTLLLPNVYCTVIFEIPFLEINTVVTKCILYSDFQIPFVEINTVATKCILYSDFQIPIVEINQMYIVQ